MKKKIIALLAVMAIGIGLIGLGACDNSPIYSSENGNTEDIISGEENGSSSSGSEEFSGGSESSDTSSNDDTNNDDTSGSGGGNWSPVVPFD